MTMIGYLAKKTLILCFLQLMPLGNPWVLPIRPIDKAMQASRRTYLAKVKLIKRSKTKLITFLRSHVVRLSNKAGFKTSNA